MKPKIFIITAIQRVGAPYPTFLMKEKNVSVLAMWAEILPEKTQKLYTAHSIHEIIDILHDELRVFELK